MAGISQRKISFVIAESLARDLDKLIAQGDGADEAAPKTIAELARDCLIVCSTSSLLAADLLKRIGLEPDRWS